MNIYLAVNTSLSMYLNEEKQENAIQKALLFIGEYLSDISKADIDVSVIAFNNSPQLVREGVTSVNEVKDALLKTTDNGLPNYLALQSLILSRHSVLNYELIVLTDADVFYPISEGFLLPCRVRFIVLNQQEERLSGRLITEFVNISMRCAHNAGMVDEYDDDLLPLVATDFTSIAQMAKKVANEKRVLPFASLSISPTMSLNVRLVPGLPKRSLAIISGEELSRRISTDQSPSFELIGFASAASILNLPSCTLMHSVTVADEKSKNSVATFDWLASGLGAESHVAIFRHSSGEECFLKPIRENDKQPWKLVLQFYPSSSFVWTLSSTSVVNPKTSFAEEKGISYKVPSNRTYWTDSHGVQSDILKLARSLRRPDRVEHYYSDLRRMATYAIACGYESYALILADILEKRYKSSTDPALRPHLDKTLEALRKGGFKLITGKQF
jgi:hypothetical protein